MARPRKAGKRTPSGRLSRSIAATRDQGTPEGRAKRTALVNGAPVELAATVPGILFARGFLTREQHDAAQRYAGLHRTAFGPAWRQACALGEAHPAAGRSKTITSPGCARPSTPCTPS